MRCNKEIIYKETTSNAISDTYVALCVCLFVWSC